MCLGGKPGLCELSESLATVEGWIHPLGMSPSPHSPSPTPQLCGTTCVVALELVRAIFSGWRSPSQVVVAVKAIPTACRGKGKDQRLLF